MKFTTAIQKMVNFRKWAPSVITKQKYMYIKVLL